MKKLIFALFAFVFSASLCFAQSDMGEISVKTITGNVATVIVSKNAKGIKPEIVIVDEKGKVLRFIVREKTLITTPDGKKLMLADINKDSNVTIEYIVKPNGNKIARSIKLK
ncbi:MAG: hypothetical protein V1739_07005 [Candidatus Omnitrophota bacterium]